MEKPYRVSVAIDVGENSYRCVIGWKGEDTLTVQLEFPRSDLDALTAIFGEREGKDNIWFAFTSAIKAWQQQKQTKICPECGAPALEAVEGGVKCNACGYTRM